MSREQRQLQKHQRSKLRRFQSGASPYVDYAEALRGTSVDAVRALSNFAPFHDAAKREIIRQSATSEIDKLRRELVVEMRRQGIERSRSSAGGQRTLCIYIQKIKDPKHGLSYRAQVMSISKVEKWEYIRILSKDGTAYLPLDLLERVVDETKSDIDKGALDSLLLQTSIQALLYERMWLLLKEVLPRGTEMDEAERDRNSISLMETPRWEKRQRKRNC